MFKENLWAELAVQVMTCQPSSLNDSSAQRDGSILKYTGIFEHAKKGIKKKKAFISFFEKRFANSQPADALVTTRGAGGQAPMVLG